MKGSLVLLFFCCLLAFMRRASAAFRHLVWSLALICVLLLPILSLAIPRFAVPVLPRAITAPSFAVGARDLAIDPTNSANIEASLTSESAVQALDSDRGRLEASLSNSASGQTSSQFERTAVFPYSWPVWVLAIWLAGLMLMLLPLFAGCVRIWCIDCSSRSIVDEPWTSLLARAMKTIGVSRPVRLRGTQQPIVPLTWGLVRPVIILPAERNSWSAERREAVLLHELSHVKRCDYLTLLIGQVTRALHWFNPLAWFAVSQLRIECERACDDCVLAAGTKASDYAAHLLEIARSLRAARLASLAAVSMAHRSQIEGRVQAILEPARPRYTPTRSSVAAAFALMLLALVPIAALEPSPTNPQPQSFADEDQPGDDPSRAVSDEPTTKTDTTIRRAADAARVVRETTVIVEAMQHTGPAGPGTRVGKFMPFRLGMVLNPDGLIVTYFDPKDSGTLQRSEVTDDLRVGGASNALELHKTVIDYTFRVRLADGQLLDAQLVARDMKSGLAVLQVDAQEIAFVQLSKSTAQMDQRLFTARAEGEMGYLGDQRVNNAESVVLQKTGLEIYTDLPPLIELEPWLPASTSIGDLGKRIGPQRETSVGAPLVNGEGELVGVVIARETLGAEFHCRYALPVDSIRNILQSAERQSDD